MSNDTKRCDGKNGIHHHYDPERFDSCPFCGKEGLVHGEGTTVGINPDSGELWASDSNDDSDVTKPVGINNQGFDPVVGWLVCIDGKAKGKDYSIKGANNFIGRDRKMDIYIEGDDKISRDKHAILTFDPKNINFWAKPGGGKGLLYVNEELVNTEKKLTANDVIELGETKLLFVPLCDEQFKW